MNTYDVVIVGGGVIGGSIAFELARRNVRATILDRQKPGQEASWAAAGILSPAPESVASLPLIPLAKASLALYPQFIGAVEDASNMRTDYRSEGTLEVLFHGDAASQLSTLVTLHHGLGLACEPLAVEEARELEPALGPDVRGAALLPNEASVNNRVLTAAVLAAAEAAGATVQPGAEVVSLVKNETRCAGVKLANGDTVFGEHVVLAAGCWCSQLPCAAPYAPTQPVRGQMVALRHGGKTIHRVLRSERGYYIVPRDSANPQNLVAGATVENTGYQKGVTSGGLEQVLGAVNELAPELAGAEIIETWCGLRPGTPDQLPILGPTGLEGLLMATGHYRNGILLAPVTAKLITEWITEGSTSLNCERFSPSRFAQESADRSATAL